MARFYLTTAIDYANGDPHLGHAFEKIGADAIARYRRLMGDDVHFLIGMDEHGQKVAQTAADAGLAPQVLTDRVAESFQRTWARLGVSHDQFIRTTSEAHRDGVQALIERIFERSPDDFFERSYRGQYCVGCEAFKTEAEIVDGRCALHPTRTLEWVEERNWFFRLSRYTEFLKRHIDAHPGFVQPASRRNEILGLLAQGLEDVSASRARFAWGVPFPRLTSDGERQTTYVWFDALPNYLTATGFPAAGYEARWPADLHVIGKDITRFHCVIWPAMLEAAGLPLPRQVWAHGFVLLGGERFSKSAGVRLDLDEAIDRFGADAFRYFLLREVPFDGDGSFSWERFEERYTADLANAFGNLASRTVAMVEKYCGGVVPPGAPNAVDAADAADYGRYHAALAGGTGGYLLSVALQQLWATVARGNEYVDRQAPWKLAKDEARRAELDATLATLVRQLARQAVALAPFMPAKAAALWAMLGAPGAVDAQRFAAHEAIDPTGWRVQRGSALFPRPEVPTA
ncbi:MAG: Methionyl-tRNA synthetase [uncultured Solirubrobacteraceae bacterium]|uniref:Methionine--tRNA ligase n=1 Tax=uncultured Solirubrobacteraceae bacterium TaxID=1162706 RepID=A0A6J4RIX0_9ACTN|nr:MAG: Methionyl-tRNA synthetase [uncultured Solirubrobacteraceae bacterium]